MSTIKTWSYDDYAALDDDKRYEVIDGELIEMAPAPDFGHQRIGTRLAIRIGSMLEASEHGEVVVSPVDVILSPEHVFQPDIIYISNQRKSIITERGVQGAPDLCIEILSPSTAKRDTGVKARRYFEFGVTEYWIVDPHTKTIDVLLRGEEGYYLGQRFGEADTLASELLPGFELNLSEVFA